MTTEDLEKKMLEFKRDLLELTWEGKYFKDRDGIYLENNQIKTKERDVTIKLSDISHVMETTGKANMFINFLFMEYKELLKNFNKLNEHHNNS